MSPEETAQARAKEEITLDDLRHKALGIRDDVVEEARAVARRRGAQLVVAGVAVVAVTISLAYFLGTRAGAARADSSATMP